MIATRLSPAEIRSRKTAGPRLATLTAYDYPTARLLDEAGIDFLLVGDSVGNTVLGYPDTTHVKLEEIAHHTRAVARGASRALIVADLPIGTYSISEQAVASARILREAGANAVKLEGGQACAEQIAAIVHDGTPVVGHIGMLPQHLHEEGGFKLKGKTEAERLFLLAEARAVERAGGFAVVLELVQADVAAEITGAVAIPTIGIGSGEGCDGQILVFHDLVGYYPWFRPKHVHPEADLASEVSKAARAYIERVRGRASRA